MSTILELRGISKYFSGNAVLSDINLAFESGELHALVGENGAGKSTMIKIISGVYHPEAGNMFLRGKQVRFATPTDAQRAGISTMFQETQEIPEMTVAENIYLGREPRLGKSFLIDRKRMRKNAEVIVRELGLNIDVGMKMSQLAVSQRKMVELVRAYMQHSDVVIMDEPTANLNAEETSILFRIIDEMKKNGTTIIYISHRMQEVFSLSDRVTVLRDGQLIATLDNQAYDEHSLISMMIGRELTDMYPKRDNKIGDVTLTVDRLTLKGKFENVSFNVHAGEIVGMVGLDASGANDVTKTLFGIYTPDSGEVRCKGRPVKMKNPAESIANHLAFLPEDRKTEGLFLDQIMISNMTLSAMNTKFSKNSFILKKLEKEKTWDMIRRLKVKCNGLLSRPEELSGGNQQKVLLGRWLMEPYDLLIVEEPTRGVDVGAKTEIYMQMSEMVKTGASILMYSTEMLEILGMCDRVLVFSQGHLKAVLDRAEATQERIMEYALVR